MSLPKIVLVLDKMIPAGTQRHVLHLIEGLHNKIEFHVVSLEGLGEWEKELKKYPAVSHHYPLHRLYDFSGWQVYHDMVYLLKKLRPVGVETFMFTAHVLGSFAAHAAGKIPVISSRREKVLWRKKSHIFLRKWANKYCCLHLANSLAVLDDVKAMEGVPEDILRHLPNGLKLPKNLKPQLKLDPEKCHAVVVAALKPVKQHSLLIEAFTRFRTELQDLILHFIGEGPLRADLEKKSLENNLKKGIYFHGKREDVLQQLPAFDFAILPSKSEGFSNSLLECLGSGLAGIAFDVDGNREAIVHEHNGLLVEAYDVEALGRAMVNMTQDFQLRKRLGEQAKRDINEKYSLKKMCELKYNYYQKVFQC